MSNDFKPVPVPASALIPVGGTNFANMNDIRELRSLEESAPAFHRNITRSLVAAGKVRENNVELEQLHNRPSKFGLGAIVKNKMGKQVTIIQVSAGHTKKTNTPVHKVADKKGNVWLEKESDLKLIL
jgi:hypothetical protein